MDRKQADAIAEALLAEGRQRQEDLRARRLRRRWWLQQRIRRNRRACAAALVAVVLAAVLSAVLGWQRWSALAGWPGWRVPLLAAGLPVFVIARWRLRPPATPLHLREL